MAAKTKSKPKLPENNTNFKLFKPVISTDVMGNRNVEIRAVGAWAQPAAVRNVKEAVVSAQYEESRMRRRHDQKQVRLKQFQDEVKKRVKEHERCKKRQELEDRYRAIESERNMVYQSLTSSQADRDGNRDARKAYRIKQGILSDITAVKLANQPEASAAAAGHVDVGAYSPHNHQVHNCTNMARRSLISKQFLTDDYRRQLIEESETDHPFHSSSHEPTVISIHDDSDVQKDMQDCDGLEGEFEEHLRLTSQDLPAKSVQFNLEPEYLQSAEIKQPFRTEASMKDNHVTKRLYADREKENERRQKQAEKAMSRRLYMDLERGNVKETNRRKEHQNRITKLKKEKEATREKEEKMAQKLVEPCDPLTGETTRETFDRELREQSICEEILHERDERRKKKQEMDRYVDALKHTLREKVERRGVVLPPLCCCGDSVWDTNPETCANNCMFYRNQKGYTKALQSLLVSCEL